MENKTNVSLSKKITGYVNRASFIDFLVIFILTSGVYIVASFYSASLPFTKFAKFIERYSETQIDEIVITLIFLSFAFSVFSLRRWKELKNEIAHRKLAEESLKLSREHLYLFVEHAPVAVAMFDKSMKYIVSSRRWLIDYGLTKENIVGRTFYELSPYLTDEWKDIHQRCLSGKTERCEECKFNRPDGTFDWIKWEVLPWYKANGEIGGIIMFMGIITEQKRIQEELRSARDKLDSNVRERTAELSRTNEILQAELAERRIVEDQLRKLSRAIEQSPSVVIITDTAGNIEYVNPKFSQLSGYLREEVIGKNPRILKSGELPLDVYNQLWQTITSGGEWRGELHNKKKNGELYWEFASISAIRNSQGIVEHYLKVSEDITERKRLEHLKDEFVSTVSHELRTPLSITKEGVSLVLDGIAGNLNEKQAEILTTSMGNIDRLARIINDLLDISKIESGKVELKKEMIDIVDLIRNVAGSFDSKVKEKGLELKMDLPWQQINIYADADRIIEVFTNLFSNATKFTYQGFIAVSIQDKGFEIECTISDTGIGIAKENMPYLFDKFRQFSRMAGGGEKGTGLGLAIVKGIIEMHKGKIWAESEIEKGTKFIFTLPKQ